MLERTFQQPKFRVCCLGGLKLIEADSGTDMTPASRKTRALLGYLCIVGKPVGRERLAALLWGDRGDEQARASLRQAIYELRSLLGGDRLLKVERDTVAVGDDVSTDMDVITAAARSGDLEQLGQALSEWRGDFFEDLPPIDPSFDGWLRSERLRVHERLVDVAIEAVDAGMARGEFDSARTVVSLLHQHDSANEVVFRLALRLDHFVGDSAALHRRYERFREQLKTELDATPAAETQCLFQELTARSSASAGNIALDSRNAVAAGAMNYAQQKDVSRATRSAVPSATPSHPGSAAEPSVSRPIANSGRWMRIAGAAIAVASLCVLAWALWSPLHKAVPSPVPVAPDFANGTSTVAMDRLLLAVDTNADPGKSNVAAIENGARAAAQSALALDPNNGEALGVNAVLTTSAHLRDIDRLFERALRSEPSNLQLLDSHARFLMMVGRDHEALGELTRAYERGRASPPIGSDLALAFMLTGRFEEARQVLDQGHNNEMRDRFFSLHAKYFLYRWDWFGLANYLRDVPDDISPSQAAFFRLCRETAIAFVTHEADRFGPLRARWRTETSIDPDTAVQFLFALGDREGALEVLQSAVRLRRNHDLLTDPEWESLFSPNLVVLRRNPRVAALLAQWGLAEYWRATNHWPDFMR